MHQIKKTTGDVVAADTQACVSAIDYAVLSHARLTASVIEGATASKLPAASTQKLLQSMTNGMNVLVSSRAEMVVAVREINMIQLRSNLKTTSFGCPDALRPTTGADDNAPVKADADLIQS
ncbi:MAG: hypothetical protein ABI668_14080 [Sphingorhabdus sp.]